MGYSKRSVKTIELLGCSWDTFARHIALQFLPGMGWHNKDLWEIDHIVAMATATTEQDVMALNHYTNLRPLWSVDNKTKGAARTHLI